MKQNWARGLLVALMIPLAAGLSMGAKCTSDQGGRATARGVKKAAKESKQFGNGFWSELRSKD